MAKPQRKLSKSMTEQQFVNGYFYATEIKAFAKEIGIQGVSNLRKDELEELILGYLRTGEVVRAARTLKQQPAVKDSDRGLDPNLSIVRYTNNRETKEFLLREAQRLEPNFKPKSGRKPPRDDTSTLSRTSLRARRMRLETQRSQPGHN